jgi:hypothetical protein
MFSTYYQPFALARLQTRWQGNFSEIEKLEGKRIQSVKK